MISANDLDLTEAIYAGARHSLVVTLLNPHSPLGVSTVLPITKWSETVEEDGDLRMFSFGVPLLVDGESMWPGDDPTHPLYPAGQQAAITWVIHAGLGVWRLPVGTYDIVNVSRDDSTVAVEVFSPMHALSIVEQPSPYITREGESMLALARRLAGTGVTLAGGLVDSTPKRGLAMDVNARKSLQVVIDAWPARARYSADGTVLVPPADTAAEPVVTIPADSGLAFDGDSISRDDIVTRVIASGSGAGAQGVGVAEELSGPLSAEYVGFQTATFSSPLLETNAAAKKGATTRLQTLRSKSRTLEVVVALDPRVEAFDVVELVQEARPGRRGGRVVGQVVNIARSFPGATMKMAVEVFSSEED